MAAELRDCPRCGHGGTARVVFERFGKQTWWCVDCGHDWDAHGPSLSTGATQREEAIATLAPHPQNKHKRAA